MSEKDAKVNADWLDELRQSTDVEPDAPPGFVLDELLGRGGMAEVYLAHRTGPRGFSRKVVIKCIRPDKVTDPLYVERFLREARLSSKFHHPHIVEVLQLIAQNDAWYIVMEYLHGLHLGHVIERLNRSGARCPAEVATFIGAGVASALDYAHNFAGEDGQTRQIVHRDISPENIMVTFSGEVKLVDFGIAKDLQGTVLSAGDHVIGKPLYLSPEALQGAPATPARDVYALGMTLYTLLAGRPPFAAHAGAEGLARLMVQISTEEPPRLSELNPEVSAELEQLIHGLLTKRPADRPTAAETHRALEQRLSQEKPVTTSSVSAFVKNLVDEDEQIEAPSPSKLGQIISPAPEMASVAQPEDVRSPPADAIVEPIAASSTWPPDASPVVEWTLDPVSEDTEMTTNTTGPMPEITEIARTRGAPRVYGNTRERRGLRVRHILTAVGVVGIGVVVASMLWPTSPVSTTQDPAFEAGALGAVPEIGVRSDLAIRASQSAADRLVGTLTVECGSWGWISVDGKKVGMCPRVSVSLEVGAHTVALEGGAGKRAKSVVISANETTAVEFTQRRAPPHVRPRRLQVR